MLVEGGSVRNKEGGGYIYNIRRLSSVIGESSEVIIWLGE
jgi:hypothetical protein